MRYIALILLSLTFSGCSNFSEPDWPEMLTCAPDSSQLVGRVGEVLYNEQDPKDALVNLAKEEGPNVVVCIVRQLWDRWTSPGAAITVQRTLAIHNAEQFLKSVGTEVTWQEE